MFLEITLSETLLDNERLGVFTVMKIQVMVFWVMNNVVMP